MHGKPLRCPKVFAGIAQSSLRRSRGSRRDQALRHRLHFARQWTEETHLLRARGKTLLEVPHPQSPQTFSHPHQRTHQEPAHHHERHRDDQQHGCNYPPEASAPDIVALIANVTRSTRTTNAPTSRFPSCSGNASSSHWVFSGMPERIDLGTLFERSLNLCARQRSYRRLLGQRFKRGVRQSLEILLRSSG